RGLPCLDGAWRAFCLGKPAIGSRVEADPLKAGELLAVVDELALGVFARDDVIQIDPGAHGRDLHAVGAHAHPDAAVDDAPERWAVLDSGPGQPAPASKHVDTAPEVLQL